MGPWRRWTAHRKTPAKKKRGICLGGVDASSVKLDWGRDVSLHTPTLKPESSLYMRPTRLVLRLITHTLVPDKLSRPFNSDTVC